MQAKVPPIVWVPAAEPGCPIPDCGIVPLVRAVNGRVRIAGTCSHFLRPELVDGRPMLGYTEEID